MTRDSTATARAAGEPVEHVFAGANWELRQAMPPGSAFSKEECAKYETLFSLANGHVGFRGDFEEPGPSWQRGTYMNGFFETEPIVYGERAYGFAKDHQTILNLPDGRIIRLIVDGEEFSMLRGTAKSYSRRLDLRRGVLARTLSWELPNGHQLELEVERLVSFTRPEAAAISYSFKLCGRGAKVAIISELNLDSENLKAAHDPRVGSKLADGCLSVRSSSVSVEEGCDGDDAHGIALGSVGTRNTRLGATCGALTKIGAGVSGRLGAHVRSARQGGNLQVLFLADVAADQAVNIQKYLVYSGPVAAGDGSRCETWVRERLNDLAGVGFAGLAREQAAYLAGFWEAADIVIDGDPALQQAARFNVYHILQSAGKDGRSSMAAKGLSGEGYEGHYFWDTEIYAVPLFTYTCPELARRLLMYRHGVLGQARARAAELGHKGALFPWRTIDGTEASAYYEAGTAQYHINADIIYAARRYALVTGDRAFLCGPLAEMAVETARLWRSAGDFIERSDGLTVTELIVRKAGWPDRTPGWRTVFVLNTMTGPDEYTALVNNNVYTNLMARTNLIWAVDLLTWIRREAPKAYADLASQMTLTDDEVREWRRAAGLIFIPYDERRQLYPQDDTFFTKAVWDLAATPKTKRPLLLHYHPLVIYRYQVLKQPDLVLAQFLHGDLFTAEEKKRNFAYYEPITTGDSSLSHCIQSIMAVETGDVEKGWIYFQKTARMDLDDLHGNAKDGIHAAAMAGSWLSLVYGFGGFREHIQTSQEASDARVPALPEQLAYSFRPVIPAELRRLRFRLRLGPSLVEVDTRHGVATGSFVTTYRLISGEPVCLLHHGTRIDLDLSCREKVMGTA